MLPGSIEKLVRQFNKLPGIGPKTAERLAFWLLKRSSSDIDEFASAISEAKKKLALCSNCFNLSDHDPCAICRDPNRDQATICVVAEIQDLLTFERLKEYKGVYHVLGGVLNPLENISPQNLNIESLAARLKKQKFQEVILGFNPDLEGETTAQYLAKTLRPLNVKITRLARGLPTGSDIEYADDLTLTSALKNRREL